MPASSRKPLRRKAACPPPPPFVPSTTFTPNEERWMQEREEALDTYFDRCAPAAPGAIPRASASDFPPELTEEEPPPLEDFFGNPKEE